MHSDPTFINIVMFMIEPYRKVVCIKDSEPMSIVLMLK